MFCSGILLILFHLVNLVISQQVSFVKQDYLDSLLLFNSTIDSSTLVQYKLVDRVDTTVDCFNNKTMVRVRCGVKTIDNIRIENKVFYWYIVLWGTCCGNPCSYTRSEIKTLSFTNSVSFASGAITASVGSTYTESEGHTDGMTCGNRQQAVLKQYMVGFDVVYDQSTWVNNPMGGFWSNSYNVRKRQDLAALPYMNWNCESC